MRNGQQLLLFKLCIPKTSSGKLGKIERGVRA